MDGVDLSHRVRALNPEMPIVLVSGDARPDAALLPAGTRYLRKPVKSRELIAAIADAIDGQVQAQA